MGTQRRARAGMRYERRRIGEQGAVPNYDCESPRQAHRKSLTCVSESKKYLFVVGMFITSRNNKISQKLELREGKLYSPGHTLLLLTSRNGSWTLAVSPLCICYPCETENTVYRFYCPLFTPNLGQCLMHSRDFMNTCTLNEWMNVSAISVDSTLLSYIGPLKTLWDAPWHPLANNLISVRKAQPAFLLSLCLLTPAPYSAAADWAYI